MKKLKFYWHIHHHVLFETLTEPVENRIDYIKKNKPAEEVALRLRLFKPVRGVVPSDIVKALRKARKVWEAWVNAQGAWVKAWGGAWVKAQEAQKEWGKAQSNPRMLILHKKECPNCPWQNGTIFPEKGVS